MDRAAFTVWMSKVDAAVESICGLSTQDLADQPFADWFTDGMTPREAATLTLEDEGFPF